MSEIRLEQVGKVYDGDVRAVDDVNLTIESGEFMVLVGPSGCGKSTLLRMIAGLEEVTEGEIWIGEREVARLAPRDRDIAMVFQNYALYPHMTVAKNLGYGLKVRKTSKAEIERRVEEVARLLGLQDLLQRRPGALSGGQRQRVAMGRAIVREPQAFLMDEPLSNLDAKLRVDMRAELARLHDRLGITTVYVTHDQVEAMTLGSRVAVMRDGTVQQVDTPQTLYREPVNLFVAAFIGSPSMNLVDAQVVDDGVEFAGFRIPLNTDRRPAGLDAGPVILGIRPQDFADARTADRGAAADRGRGDGGRGARLGDARPLHRRGASRRDGLGPGGQRRRRAGDAARHRPPRALHRRGRGGNTGAAGGPDRARTRSGTAPLLRPRNRREPALGGGVCSAGELAADGERRVDDRRAEVPRGAPAEAGPHDPAVGAWQEHDRSSGASASARSATHGRRSFPTA